MTKISLLIIVSVIIQLVTAFLAFRMIRFSRHAPGWILISLALLLMGVRRITTLLSYHLPGTELFRGIGAEAIALLISILMLCGVVLIRRYFILHNQQHERLRESEQRYKALSDQLEHRIEERTQGLSDIIQSLQECQRTKADFLSKMSHELRTPLNAVIGFSDVLLTGMDGELTAEQKKDVQLIFNSAQHLLQLINDLLDVSRLESGKFTLNHGPVEISRAVSDVVSDMMEKALEKGLALRQDIPAGLPAVEADPLRLDQILRNLIDNAVKFTQRGEVLIQAALSDRQGEIMRSIPEDAPGFVRVSVQDTGIGIPGEKISAIFDTFHQLDSGPSRRYEGTGLGLTITRSLVDLHGGRTGVKSEPGKGSLFWFTLPIFKDNH
ncbi:MAG: ATP-binding protein [bacterium]